MPKYHVKPSKDIREGREGDKWLVHNTISFSAFRLDLYANTDWNCTLQYHLTMITFIVQWSLFGQKRNNKQFRSEYSKNKTIRASSCQLTIHTMNDNWPGSKLMELDIFLTSIVEYMHSGLWRTFCALILLSYLQSLLSQQRANNFKNQVTHVLTPAQCIKVVGKQWKRRDQMAFHFLIQISKNLELNLNTEIEEEFAYI